ncbi:hypothetical protein Tco_1520687, partial [Tanacetum coccineum]
MDIDPPPSSSSSSGPTQKLRYKAEVYSEATVSGSDDDNEEDVKIARELLRKAN